MNTRRMKIGIIITGEYMTPSEKERAVENFDLRENDSLCVKIDADFVNSMAERVSALLPSTMETFCVHVTSQNEMIDVASADAYVLVPIHRSSRLLSPLRAKNRPIVIYVPKYSEIFSYGAVFYPYFMRDARKIGNILGLDPDMYLASDDTDFRKHMDALLVRHRMRNTKVVCIGEAMTEPYHSFDWGYEMIRLAQQKFGLEWIHWGAEKFLRYFDSCAPSPAGQIEKEATENRLPGEYQTSNSLKTYHVYKKILEHYGANAFTVNCLASTVHTTCNTTSCYALSRLNDEGIVSACEADVTTLMNMLIVTYASNAPVFMCNPYLFPHDNKLFLSHCTSPLYRTFDSSEKDPYHLYTYFENPDLPCALQVIKESGPVTITGISHDRMDKMIIVTGNIVRNTAFPSCRTQIEINISGDIKQLAEQYEGRHWVMVYGNQQEKIERANKLLGIESILI